MNKTSLLLLLSVIFFFSCSDSEPEEMGPTFAEEILGGWQLETIRIDGVDCPTLFPNAVNEYPADEEGCATPTEVLGNASRCINLELRADGVGTFLWSEITGGEDAEINYTTTDDEFEYCFEGSSCSGSFVLVGTKLESSFDVGFDDDCNVVYVLRRK